METNKNTNNAVDEFIGMCMMSVTYIHSAHFATNSYAQHKALGDFYTEMEDLIDTFVEVNIGITGSYTPTLQTETTIEPVSYIKSIAEAGTNIYDTVDTSLQSIIDEIKVLCYQTIYKLTKLH